MSYDAEDIVIQGRKLKVNTVAIPIQITLVAGVITAVTNDLPSRLFARTDNIDQITAALSAGEVAAYDFAPSDANGNIQFLLDIKQKVEKVVSAELIQRTVNPSVFLDPTDQPLRCVLGSSTGITTGVDKGRSIMLITSTNANMFASVDSLEVCLVVRYAAKN